MMTTQTEATTPDLDWGDARQQEITELIHRYTVDGDHPRIRALVRALGEGPKKVIGEYLLHELFIAEQVAGAVYLIFETVHSAGMHDEREAKEFMGSLWEILRTSRASRGSTPAVEALSESLGTDVSLILDEVVDEFKERIADPDGEMEAVRRELGLV